MKAIWTGAIGFGLVNIPVKLYSASEESTLDLDMLDKKDFSHIKFQRVNENTGKVVEWENIVKGYKYDDRYVILEAKDFEAAAAEKTKEIEIEQFVKEDEIDTIYYEKPYYLEPAKGGERAYTLLRDALADTKKVGIGTIVLRSKESLMLVKPKDGVLVLNRLRFAEEIRDTKELNFPEKAKADTKELKMAKTLIDELTEEFNIKKYHDTYSAKLMKVIKAKAKGKKIVTPKMKVVHRRSEDLMEQLKASLKKKAS
jgi:DNA end-binding protein Ku